MRADVTRPDDHVERARLVSIAPGLSISPALSRKTDLPAADDQLPDCVGRKASPRYRTRRPDARSGYLRASDGGSQGGRAGLASICSNFGPGAGARCTRGRAFTPRAKPLVVAPRVGRPRLDDMRTRRSGPSFAITFMSPVCERRAMTTATTMRRTAFNRRHQRESCRVSGEGPK